MKVTVIVIGALETGKIKKLEEESRFSLVMISKNIERSPGGMRKFAVTQTGRKNSQGVR